MDEVCDLLLELLFAKVKRYEEFLMKLSGFQPERSALDEGSAGGVRSSKF